MIAGWRVFLGVVVAPALVLSLIWPAERVIGLRHADLVERHADLYRTGLPFGAMGVGHDLLRAGRSFVPLPQYLDETLSERGIEVSGTSWNELLPELAAGEIFRSAREGTLAGLVDQRKGLFRDLDADFLYLAVARSDTGPVCLEARLIGWSDHWLKSSLAIPASVRHPAREHLPWILALAFLAWLPLGLALPGTRLPASAYPSPESGSPDSAPVSFRNSNRLITNPYFLGDILRMVFFTYAIMVVLVGGLLQARSLDGLWAFHTILLWLMAGFTLLFLVIAALFYGDRQEVEYTLDATGASMQEVGASATISRTTRYLAILLGVLGRHPGVVGAGLLARGSLSMDWDEVEAIEGSISHRTVVLRPGFGPELRIHCPDQSTFRQVLARASRCRRDLVGVSRGALTGNRILAGAVILLYLAVISITLS